ncbi:hypothetical protein PHSY_002922 [Pseudozyma hubeiensis SY62]|uniref:BZIP domain-containing protein n=1 Tax=Pseudozyma hubeiensis (strain SY62) TaxID=1305764 RepID=R9P2D9_PSEHS|nr:hypothetical protein PHSY_002922 [Pseudozyma hubeiensis SY62]GAC95347.1 hypothetical protein PHSY_002922 [Pseudozyma hubeiensis SY62]
MTKQDPLSSTSPSPPSNILQTASEYTHSNLDPHISNASESAPPAAEAAPAEAAVQDADHAHAMEAVMQLAQAASQQQYDQQHSADSDAMEQEHQQHGHVENPHVHHDSLPVNNGEDSAGGEKRGSKRRSSLHASPTAAGRGRRGSKAARNDDDHDVAEAAAAAAVAAAQNGDNLPFPESWSDGNLPAEIQKAYQQHLAQAQANLSSTPPATEESPATAANASSPSFKPTRQLSTSKRAAQNRAAQRAFRERRDKYVKVLESKAARLEVAINVATECKRRYAETLQTIDGLRQDNHTLRVALAALSGSNVEGQAPPASKADDLLAALPEIPQLTTDEEESVLQGQASGQQSLDSLSAVAAAAAAAVDGSASDAGRVAEETGGDQPESQEAVSSKGTESSVALPQPPSASAASPSTATAAPSAQ